MPLIPSYRLSTPCTASSTPPTTELAAPSTVFITLLIASKNPIVISWLKVARFSEDPARCCTGFLNSPLIANHDVPAQVAAIPDTWPCRARMLTSPENSRLTAESQRSQRKQREIRCVSCATCAPGCSPF